VHCKKLNLAQEPGRENVFRSPGGKKTDNRKTGEKSNPHKGVTKHPERRPVPAVLPVMGGNEKACSAQEASPRRVEFTVDPFGVRHGRSKHTGTTKGASGEGRRKEP